MSAPKQYDRTELLDRAIELFRRQGYCGTSTAELVADLGINRKSMYAEFGSKQGVFEAALERYDQRHLTATLSPIEAPDAGAESIRNAFANYAAASESRFSGLGCLMCNTAIERAALDAASGRFVAAYIDRVTRAFRQALVNARSAGHIKEVSNVDELAAFFTMALIGVSACIRAKAPSDQIYAACNVAAATLDAHRPS
jgi:TetR/AcrR family transcriptional regulator, transcriptional repressor for nem operon